VDDLYDDLCDISDNKLEEATKEKESIMKSGWVELQITNYINHMRNLMRIEILYFWTIYQLLNDFYNYNLGKEFQQK